MKNSTILLTDPLLNQMARAGAFFVTRAKGNLRFSRQSSRPVDPATGLRSDQTGTLALAKAFAAISLPLRRVRYYDAQTDQYLIFLTNHLDLPGLTVAGLYQLRWQIELFFRWVQGHLPSSIITEAAPMR